MRLLAAVLLVLTLPSVASAQQLIDPPITPPGGSQIVVNTPAPNVTVQVTPPAPDPAATMAMYSQFVDVGVHDLASVPVNWAKSLLGGPNLWTNTPADKTVDLPAARAVRATIRTLALGLLAAAIVWTGIQIAVGPAFGIRSWQELLPLLLVGFVMAWFSEDILHLSLEANNAVCAAIGQADLTSFGGSALDLPPSPAESSITEIPAATANVLTSFITSALYAVVLVLLLFTLLIRIAVLAIIGALFPLVWALWVIPQVRWWAGMMLRAFYGWLFGQVLLVTALVLSGGLFGLSTDFHDVGHILVSLAVLWMSFKLITSLGGSAFAAGVSIRTVLALTNAIRRGGGRGAGTVGARPAAAGSRP